MKVSGMDAFSALTEIIMLNEEHNVRNGQPSYGLLVRQSRDPQNGKDYCHFCLLYAKTR